MRKSLILLLATALPLAAQRGDKADHHSMDPVVPESEIPPAPVRPVEDAMETFEVESGFVIEPVAAEPLVEMPVCLDFDSAGRMWVCEMLGYMPDIDGKGESRPQGRLTVLEDLNGDGRVDQRTVFLDDLLLPRAISVWEDGILFLDQDRLCWIGRDGLKPVGEVELVDPGFASGGNVEHKPNGLLYNLDNWLYNAKCDKRIRRYGDTWRIESTTFRGQWGIARDDFGRLYHNHNSTFLYGESLGPDLLQGNRGVRFRVREWNQLGSKRVFPIRVTPGINRAYIDRANGYDSNMLDPRTHKLINCTAAAGMTVYRGTNFPESWYGTAFVTESSVNLVKAIRIADEDGRLSGEQVLDDREFLASTDERFRPVNAYTAPDGSLYVLDMYHGIIQHRTFMTSYLREQTLSRGLDKPGRGLGRIYRIRSRSGELEPSVDISSLEGLDLVRMLMHENSWHRETAQRVIVQRRDPELLPHLATLVERGQGVGRIQAVWTLEGLGALQASHLEAPLTQGEPKVRVSALWAASRLSSPELAKLEPILLREDFPVEARPYLARLLGQIASDRSLAALAELLEDHGRQEFVRQTAVAGLDGNERRFLDQLGNEGDRDLRNWLEQGARGEKKREGPSLQGAALASFERGGKLYHGEAACFGCHGPDGSGLDDLGPPLDGSEWVTGDSERLAKIMLHGMIGPVTVAGETYNPPAAMPGLSFNEMMTDQKLADIATYVRNEWSNKADPLSEEWFAEQRAATADRAGQPYTAEELNAGE